MPCKSDWDDYSTISKAQEDYNKIKQELDKVTKLLCYAMTEWEKTEGFNYGCRAQRLDSLAKELKQWWMYHQALDRERLKKEAKEAARQEEINRLKNSLTIEQIKLIKENL